MNPDLAPRDSIDFGEKPAGRILADLQPIRPDRSGRARAPLRIA